MGLESVVGKGSTFWIEVDVTEIASEQDMSSDDTPVLVVSTNEGAGRTFSRAGATSVTLVQPAEAADVVQRLFAAEVEAPLIVVDYELIGDGWVTLRHELDKYPRHTYPVVAILKQAGLEELSTSDKSIFACSISLPQDENVARRAIALAKRARVADKLVVEREGILTPAGRSLSILVAEDNRTNQMVIGMTLERAGHRPIIVNNGEEALEALETDRFDIVLMDINMPIMNGIEATKLYRFNSVGRSHVPIIALTADASEHAWSRCKDAGMDGYATKPIEPDRLLQAIDVAVGPEAHIADKPITKIMESHSERLRESSSADPLVDMGSFMSLIKLGGQSFVSGLISQFGTDLAELLSSMRAAVAEENVSSFRDGAHALRGSAANLGASKVFSSCLSLRTITASELALEGDRQLEELNAELDRTIEVFKAFVAANCEKSAEDIAENVASVSRITRRAS